MEAVGGGCDSLLFIFPPDVRRAKVRSAGLDSTLTINTNEPVTPAGGSNSLIATAEDERTPETEMTGFPPRFLPQFR